MQATSAAGIARRVRRPQRGRTGTALHCLPGSIEFATWTEHAIEDCHSGECVALPKVRHGMGRDNIRRRRHVHFVLISSAGDCRDNRPDVRRFWNVWRTRGIEAATGAIGASLNRVTDRQSLLRALDMLRLSYLSHKGSDVILEPGFGP